MCDRPADCEESGCEDCENLDPGSLAICEWLGCCGGEPT